MNSDLTNSGDLDFDKSADDETSQSVCSDSSDDDDDNHDRDNGKICESHEESLICQYDKLTMTNEVEVGRKTKDFVMALHCTNGNDDTNVSNMSDGDVAATNNNSIERSRGNLDTLNNNDNSVLTNSAPEIGKSSGLEMSVCRNCCLLPAEEIMDVEAKLIYIYNVLVELVDLHESSFSRVAIEYDRVSVICDETWKCQIYLNDDREKLLLEHMNWIKMYGGHLKKEDQQNMLSSFPRLDLICDPDEEGDFEGDYQAITEYLRLVLRIQYSFDPIKRRFIVHREA